MNFSSKRSLLKRVPRVPKCLSPWIHRCLLSARVLKCWVPNCPIDMCVRVPECPSALWVNGCLKYSSALRVPFEYPSTHIVYECPSAFWLPFQWPQSALEMPLKSPLSAKFPFECDFCIKKVCNITGNELVNSFIEFLKTFQNTYFT